MNVIASYLTSITGSSNYFSSGIISYSNESKIKLLNVSSKILDKFGEVSEPVAKEMALGSMKIADSDIALSITGYFESLTAVGAIQTELTGKVCFGIATISGVKTYTHYFLGTRESIRQSSCEVSLNLVLDILS